MSLRVVAVAAPQFPVPRRGSRALNSTDPASMFNACRVAAERAGAGVGPWADSNWNASRAERRSHVLLEDALTPALERLEERLLRLRPNLLLIGSMSVCQPGAIACARRAKEHLGDRICVVLGGKHPSETLHSDSLGIPRHHPGSPLRLMADAKLDPVFDLVVAGAAESLVPAIGELVARCVDEGRPAAEAASRWVELVDAPGPWTLGRVRRGRVEVLPGRGGPLPYDSLPAPCEMFGVTAEFPVFAGCRTAHVFSDSGGTCVYDCDFCSERRSAGPIRELETSADRLHRQLEAAARTIREDEPDRNAAAFVEDSTFLTFAPRLVERFVTLRETSSTPIRIGGQLTVDQVLARPQALTRMRAVGVDYLFIGFETLDPDSLGGMKKDVGRRTGPWVERVERAVRTLAERDIRCGVALLFGMGETQGVRLEMLKHVRSWQDRYGEPITVSMNWAVQHPLFGHDAGTGYEYLDWAIPEGPFHDAFRDYGEASVRYPMGGCEPPRLDDVLELRSAADELYCRSKKS